MKVKPFFPPPFSLSSFTFIKRLFSSSLISAIRVVSFETISHFQRTNLFNRKVSSTLDSLLPTVQASRRCSWVQRSGIWWAEGQEPITHHQLLSCSPILTHSFSLLWCGRAWRLLGFAVPWSHLGTWDLWEEWWKGKSNEDTASGHAFCLPFLVDFMWREPGFSSVQFSCSVMSNSLWPHGLQHTRLPCPSPTPRACSNSCP